jgi:hypothetical protein
MLRSLCNYSHFLHFYPPLCWENGWNGNKILQWFCRQKIVWRRSWEVVSFNGFGEDILYNIFILYLFLNLQKIVVFCFITIFTQKVTFVRLKISSFSQHRGKKWPASLKAVKFPFIPNQWIWTAIFQRLLKKTSRTTFFWFLINGSRSREISAEEVVWFVVDHLSFFFCTFSLFGFLKLSRDYVVSD